MTTTQNETCYNCYNISQVSQEFLLMFQFPHMKNGKKTMTLIALKIQQAPGSAMWRADVWDDSSESTHQYMVLMVCKYGCNMLTIQKCAFLCQVWTAPVLHVELSTTSTATYLWRREEAQEPTTHSWNEKVLPPCWLWPPWSVWAWATAWATEHPMELNSVMYLGISFDVIWGMCDVFKREITGPILGKHPNQDCCTRLMLRCFRLLARYQRMVYMSYLCCMLKWCPKWGNQYHWLSTIELSMCQNELTWNLRLTQGLWPLQLAQVAKYSIEPRKKTT